MDNYRSNMRILELFAGTGSVGDVCRRLGHEVISLDRDLHADIECDIMDWDYRTYQPKHFDFIWASNKKRHLSTKKHNDAQYVLTDRFEIM